MTDAINPLLPRPVIIVDAFGRGSVLAKAFAEQAPCIHVTSRSGIPDVFLATLQRGLFAEHLDAPALGWVGLLDALRALKPAAVLTGNELGVELADRLADALGLAGNGSAGSAARRDKFAMAAALERAGVPIPKQAKFADGEAAAHWFGERRTPVVVKPLDSAGSDDVHICRNPDEVVAACRRTLGVTNLMLNKNNEILIQDYMEGDEYIINCVSQDRHHVVTDIWALTKRLVASGRRKIYDRHDLVDSNNASIDALCNYVRATLDALGISHGPSHSEVMMTVDGPMLIEVGARVSGQIIPHPFGAVDIDQIGLTVAGALSPGVLSARPGLYRQRAHACIIESIVPRWGRLNHVGLRRAAECLPSFSHLRFRAPENAIVEPAIDLSSAPSSVFLMHEDVRQIEADYHAFRRWELEGDDFVMTNC